MELPFELVSMRDEPRPQRDGSALWQKRVEFYLGKFGPFVEYLPREATQSDISARVDRLRLTLNTLPT